MSQIYDDIPVPPRKVRTAARQVFELLEVGQSLYFHPKTPDEPIEKTASRVMGAVSRYRRAQPINTLKFAVRIAPHPVSGDQAVGVWRVA